MAGTLYAAIYGELTPRPDREHPLAAPGSSPATWFQVTAGAAVPELRRRRHGTAGYAAMQAAQVLLPAQSLDIPARPDPVIVGRGVV
ncbi:hypothetical protein OG943_13755 [Amycolatopsis sp. NBC_00345]|uniref:hypothetical protein n=1 Tax=Amycolatopsis sp. NBC_00345 TaxID=2975955 RepID=UPI002E259CF4